MQLIYLCNKIKEITVFSFILSVLKSDLILYLVWDYAS